MKNMISQMKEIKRENKGEEFLQIRNKTIEMEKREKRG